MRTITLLAFLAKVLAQTYFENAGLAINELDPIELFNPKREVHFIRSFSTKPTREILDRIERCIAPDEISRMEKDNRIAESVNKMAFEIADGLESHWQSAMTSLQIIAGRNERSAWDSAKSAAKYLYNSPFLRSVIQTAMPSLGNYLSAMTDKDHHEKIELLEHKLINNTHLIHQSNNILLSRLVELETKHCELHNRIFLENEMTRMIATVESEILSVSLGQIPHQANFVKGVLESCSKIGNTPRFCHRVLDANLISLTFNGLTFEHENSTLISYATLKIPVEKTSMSKVGRFEVVNLGAWLADQFFKLDIEGTFIRGRDNEIFELDQEKCNKNFCPFEAIRVQTPKCLSSLIANSTEGCEIIFQNHPAYCEIRNFGPNFLIAIPEGDIIYSNPITTEAIHNQTILIKDKVTLSCHGPSGTKTVALHDEIFVHSSHHSELNLLTLELSETPRTFSRNLKVLSDISDLKDSEDSILIGKSDMKISLVILLGAAISVIVSVFLPHVAGKCRSLIVALISRFHNKKGKLSKKGPSETVEKQAKLDRRRSVHFETRPQTRPQSFISRPQSMASRPESFVSINLDGFAEIN